MVAVLIYNITLSSAAPEQKKENGLSISGQSIPTPSIPGPVSGPVSGPSMPKKEGFRTGEECSKCEAELKKCRGMERAGDGDLRRRR